MNVTSVAFVSKYLETGMPLTTKRLTVDGDIVKQPKNVEVIIGTPIQELLDFCGGLTAEPGKILYGGPMMGTCVADLSQPILKNNNAILAFSQERAKLPKASNCIQCGRCVNACPLGLAAKDIVVAFNKGNVELLNQLHADLCMSCGTCSFVCPRQAASDPSIALAKIMMKNGGKVMANKLIVSAAPHITSADSTSKIMGRVCIALLPTLIASVLIFGFQALLLTAVTVAACVVFEYAYCKLVGRDVTISDLSAVVTGLLLAFNLPAGLPVWMSLVGAFIAIVIIKQLFGGLGYNFANPAIVGRIAMALGFTGAMTSYTYPENGIDALASATPLAVEETAQNAGSYVTLLLGNHGGVLVRPAPSPC